MRRPLALIILDGYGDNADTYGNAIHAAATPNMDRYRAQYPQTQINASGMSVGLPEGQMGNSEVGHTNIGAGRVVYQELTRITKSIQDGDFFRNEALLGAIKNCRTHSSSLHLMGLISDGGVHSHNTHLYALLEFCKREKLEKVYIHCFMDGRDVPPRSGKDYIAELQTKIRDLGVGEIATIMGRYYAMDRDKRWDRVEKAYAAMVYGHGDRTDYETGKVMERSYEKDITDEFVLPTVCLEGGSITPHDSVIFFNFRPDRARELTRTFVDPDFDAFKRENADMQLYFVCMTQYDATMPNVHVAFAPESLDNTFGEYIAEQGLKQLRIAETEKYAHVTFFFNGGVEAPYPGEDRALIPSPKAATYDLQPEMSAYAVTDTLMQRLEEDFYDVIILNFANCDMVGHTGVFDATVKAVEAVDDCLGRIVDKILAMGGVALITADHGNADKMYEDDGSPFTAHTTNIVPFVAAGAEGTMLPPGEGRLADIAPTMLKLLGLPQPPEMTGQSILQQRWK